MIKYPRIYNPLKRVKTEKGEWILTTQYSTEEFSYLAFNLWGLTEKIDGMNIRVWIENGCVYVGGRTDNAILPLGLKEKIVKLFLSEKEHIFNGKYEDLIFFGEGIGPKIQGNKYKRDYDFVLFDIGYLRNDELCFLERKNVEEIAGELGLKVCKVCGEMSLYDIFELVRSKPKSFLNENVEIEGFVARPTIELRSKYGDRIITKIKVRDFAK